MKTKTDIGALAAQIATSLPESPSPDDGGPSTRDTVALILAMIPGMTVDRARRAARVGETMDAIARARTSLASKAKTSFAGYAVTMSADAVALAQGFGGCIPGPRVLMSHSTGEAIPYGDDPWLDEVRLDAILDIVAEEMATKGYEGDLAERANSLMLQQGQSLVIQMPCAHPELAPALTLHPRRVAHGSLAMIRREARQAAIGAVRSDERHAKLEEQARAEAEDIEQRLAALGCPLACRGRVVSGPPRSNSARTGIDILMLDDRLRHDWQRFHFYATCKEPTRDAALARVAREHLTRLKRLGGVMPAQGADVDPMAWSVDRALAVLLGRTADPVGALAAILASDPADEYALGRALGDPELRGTVRAADGEATVRTQLSAGIMWSHGTVTVDLRRVRLPETLVMAVKGRPLGALVSHPLVPADAEVVNAVVSKNTAVIQTRRELVDPFAQDTLPLAA